MPARIYGEKIETGAHLEILLLNNIEGDSWETLIKPAKRAKVGTKITFGDGRLEAVVEKNSNMVAELFDSAMMGFS